MLRPNSTHEKISADALMAAAVARDESIYTHRTKEIRLISAHRQSVILDDLETVQPLDVVAEYLDAPKSFLATADVSLAQYIVDHQLRKVNDRRELVFRNNKAIGSQPFGSKRIKGEQVVEKLIDAVGDVSHANLYDMGDHVDITIVGDKVTMKPKVGDITEGGLRCLYSELLSRNPSIEPYVERLVCLNGMICTDRLDVFKFDTIEDFLHQMDASIVKSMQFVDTAIRAQLQNAAETKIDRSEQVLRQIFDSNRMNPRLLGRAIAA